MAADQIRLKLKSKQTQDRLQAVKHLAGRAPSTRVKAAAKAALADA